MSEKVTEEKASWVCVTVTGDPQLAKEVKAFLALMLDWAILDEQTVLKVRHDLKHYDFSTALKSTDRASFYIVKKDERVIEEKAGFRTEKAKSEDKKEL